MRVKQLMTSNVKSCRENTDLATAARLMWEGDCGVVPVVDNEGRVAGVVTDRDICIAAATRAMRPSDIRVADVMSRDVATCSQDSDVRTALMLLKERRVRRLPVVDQNERLAGILSLNDLVSRAECQRGSEVPGEEFLDVLKAICAHPVATAAV